MSDLSPQVVRAALDAVRSNQEMLNAVATLETHDLRHWAMARGMSEHDSRKLVNSMSKFLESSASSMKSASEVLGLLAKIMDVVEQDLEDRDDGTGVQGHREEDPR